MENMKAEILCVGTELLLGDIVNTNAQFLSKELAKLGIPVYYQSVVGDNPNRLTNAIDTALSRSNIVITTGGLGPTKDDLTKEIIANALGKTLEFDQKAYDMMEERVKALKVKTISQSNAKQGMIIKDSIVLYNNHGTAPGYIVEGEGKTVILLPGPPREMKAMFNEYVKEYFEKKTNQVMVSFTLNTYGIGESRVNDVVNELLDSTNPSVAPYAKEHGTILRITARAKDKDEANSMILPMKQEIEKRLGEHIYGYNEDTLADCVVNELKKKQVKLGCMEGATAGMVTTFLSNVKESKYFVYPSLITNSNEQVSKFIEITKNKKELALQMCKYILKNSDCDIALSITPYSSDDNEHAVICIYDNKKERYFSFEAFGTEISSRVRLSDTALYQLLCFLKEY